MSLSQTLTPASVLLLADHLDAVLAAGEDIMKLAVDVAAVAKSDGIAAPWDRFEELVAKAHLYELTIVSRVLQARTRAREAARDVGKEGAAFASLLELFASGTAVLEEAIAELAQRAGAQFDSGLDPMVYLRTRGVLPAETGSLIGIGKIEIAEGFLVARRIELGGLLDMAAALLDALDLTYGLFAEAERTERSGCSDVAISSHESDAPLQAAGT